MSAAQEKMRQLAKQKGRFLTREFSTESRDKLGVPYRTARAYVAAMFKLGLIVEDGVGVAIAGPVPTYWRWVGGDLPTKPATPWEPPKRYASVWHYASNITT